MAEDTETVDDTPGAEYPKMLYKGVDLGDEGYNDVAPDATITVKDSTEEKAARADGYAELGAKKAAKASS